jgi:hypothetical protein
MMSFAVFLTVAMIFQIGLLFWWPSVAMGLGLWNRWRVGPRNVSDTGIRKGRGSGTAERRRRNYKTFSA